MENNATSDLNKLERLSQSLWWGKLGHQGAICWLKKGLSMVHGTLNIFFRNKTFLFVKTEIWNFQHLFDLLFRETSQNFSSFEQLLFPIEKCCLNVCLNELKFCKVSQNTKSNSCWKITIDSFFFSQQMPYYLLTLLVYMALGVLEKTFV